MAKFDAQNGWIQLVFMNKEDRYVLPSMVRVSADRYLFYCLKQAGYEAIYYFDMDEEGIEMTCMDPDSAQYYQKIRPQSFYEKYFTFSEDMKHTDQGGVTARLQNDIVTEKLFYQMINGKKKSAMVFSIESFDNFFSKNERAKKFIEKYQSQKSNNNLILVCASTRGDESCRYFTNEEGILYRLSEEIRQAVCARNEAHLFENMKKNMGETCVYLNELEHDLIENLVRRHRMFEPQEDFLTTDDEEEKTALMIEWFYHSKKFRSETALHLPENKKRELKVIDESLSNARVQNDLRTWLDTVRQCQTGEELKKYLTYLYPKDEMECFIYSDHFILRLWEQMNISEDMITSYQKSLFETIADRIKAVIFLEEEKLDKLKLNRCMEQIKKAIKNQKAEALRYGIQGMDFLLDQNRRYENTDEEIWKFFNKLFELCDELYRLDQEMCENEHRIATLKQRFQELDERYVSEQEEQKLPDAQINLLLEEILDCDKEITLAENIQTLKKEQRKNYQSVIETIADAIQTARNGSVVNVQLVYERALELQRKMLEKSIASMKEMPF